MNAEPGPPKNAGPKSAQPKADAKTEAKPDEDAVPVPPKRPQAQAGTPPAQSQ